MEKVRKDAKQAEREERKRDIESQKEQLRLRAERERWLVVRWKS